MPGADEVLLLAMPVPHHRGEGVALLNLGDGAVQGMGLRPEGPGEPVPPVVSPRELLRRTGPVDGYLKLQVKTYGRLPPKVVPHGG